MEAGDDRASEVAGSPERRDLDEAERTALRAAIELLHGCAAAFRSAETVSVEIQGRRVWRRRVATFDLTGHPTARVCYAWTDHDANSRVHHRVVLHSGPVRSARDAVSAFFLADSPANLVESKD
jgi:hypothetical protein